jgi:hypothetical protein
MKKNEVSQIKAGVKSEVNFGNNRVLWKDIVF